MNKPIEFDPVELDLGTPAPATETVTVLIDGTEVVVPRAPPSCVPQPGGDANSNPVPPTDWMLLVPVACVRRN